MTEELLIGFDTTVVFWFVFFLHSSERVKKELAFGFDCLGFFCSCCAFH